MNAEKIVWWSFVFASSVIFHGVIMIVCVVQVDDELCMVIDMCVTLEGEYEFRNESLTSVELPPEVGSRQFLGTLFGTLFRKARRSLQHC